jgi:hypothetical protein
VDGRVFESINEKFDLVGLESVFPASVFAAARPLLAHITLPGADKSGESAAQAYFETEALSACTARGAANLTKRSTLIDTLLQELSRGGGQHWRYEVMCANLLELLQRPDVPIDRQLCCYYLFFLVLYWLAAHVCCSARRVVLCAQPDTLVCQHAPSCICKHQLHDGAEQDKVGQGCEPATVTFASWRRLCRVCLSWLARATAFGARVQTACRAAAGL